MNAGIHTVPESAYHADCCEVPSLSNSIVKVLLGKSPRHAWMAHPKLNPEYEADEDSKYDVGSAAHAALLEGRDICVIVDAADWRTKAAQTARDDARAAGKVPLLPPQHAKLQAMVAAARGYLAAARLGHVLDCGAPEQTLVWQDGGAQCRARLDWLTDDRKLILDYKSTKVANPDKWIRGMTDLGADTQSAFYTRGLRKIGFDRARFLFLVQEDSAPYCCFLVELGESMQQLADIKVERAINLWSQCMREDRWPAYSTDVHVAEAPPWALALEGIMQ